MGVLELSDGLKVEFMERYRMKCGDEDYYLTESILSKTFDFFVDNVLTVKDNGEIFWYAGDEKVIESSGYSGGDSGYRDGEEGMIDNILHEVYCKAEWVARSLVEGFSDVCKQYFGEDSFDYIIS